MSKGFKLTLMSVAIALFGMQSMTFAMAPVVQGVPDIIVGDVENATQPNTFVYPEAFNLGAYVTDQDTPDQDIIWSYAVAGTPVRYLINGKQPLDLASEDPVTPPADKRIAGQNVTVAGGEVDQDNNPQTITIRDQILSPLGGTNVEPTSGTRIAGQQAVTLFASDGTSTDSAEIMIYSDNGGRDRLSGAGVFDPNSNELVQNVSFTGGQANGFATTGSGPTFGTVTYSVGANGISIGVPGPDSSSSPNIGYYQSADNFITLVNNSVWRVRATVTSDVTTVNTTPLWDIVLNNYSSSIGGPFGFGGDYLFLDNEGSANAAGNLGRTSFELWYTPLAMGQASFDNVFSTNLDNVNDLVLMFRVIDGNEGIGSSLDAGTITMNKLEVDRYALDRVAVTSNMFNAASITNGTDATPANTDFRVRTIFNTSTNVDYSGGILTVSPVGAAWTNGEAVDILPGDAVEEYGTNPASLVDNFPVLWESSTLYRVRAELSVPDLASEASPSDVITVGVGTPTNELNNFSYISSNGTYTGMLMPTVTPKTYQMFFFSHTRTTASVVNADRLRPYVQVLNVGGSNGQIGPNPTVTGAVQFRSMSMDKVTIADPGFQP